MWFKVDCDGIKDFDRCPVYPEGFADGAYAVYDLYNDTRKYRAWEKKMCKLAAKAQEIFTQRMDMINPATHAPFFMFKHNGHEFLVRVADLDNCGFEQ